MVRGGWRPGFDAVDLKGTLLLFEMEGRGEVRLPDGCVADAGRDGLVTDVGKRLDIELLVVRDDVGAWEGFAARLVL